MPEVCRNCSLSLKKQRTVLTSDHKESLENKVGIGSGKFNLI